MFADMFEFEGLSGANCHSRIVVPGFDDIVFEVLRFIYYGTIFFQLGFRKRFAEFLSVIEYLGLEEMVERERGTTPQGAAPVLPSIFAESGVEHWLSDLSVSDLRDLLEDASFVGCSGAAGHCGLGFSIRRAFVGKLAELRPQDLTADALGTELARRLVHCGDQPSSTCLLPLSVRYVSLASTESPRLIRLGDGPDAIRASQDFKTQAGERRFWHGCRPVDPAAIRPLAQAAGPAGLVIFGESLAGQRAFDVSVRRALLRPAEHKQAFARSMERVLRLLYADGLEAPLPDDDALLVWDVQTLLRTLPCPVGEAAFPAEVWGEDVLRELPYRQVQGDDPRVLVFQRRMAFKENFEEPFANLGMQSTGADDRPWPSVGVGAPEDQEAEPWQAGRPLVMDEETHIEVVLLGSLFSKAASQADESAAVRGAPSTHLAALPAEVTPLDGLLWDLHVAVEAVGDLRPKEGPPLLAVALRRVGPTRTDALPRPGVPVEGDGWFGGIILGESVAQILLRWSRVTGSRSARCAPPPSPRSDRSP